MLLLLLAMMMTEDVLLMWPVTLSFVPDDWVVKQVEHVGVELTLEFDAFTGGYVVRVTSSQHAH